MNSDVSSVNTPMYLCAPVNTLIEGIFEQKIPLGEIKKHGDLGLGTFDHLDGEMVILDGIIYQIDGEGRVNIIEDDKTTTPFTCLTFFKPISVEEVDGRISYEDFLKWLEDLMPSPNVFYAFRIRGLFRDVTVRSVSKQDSLKPLAEITVGQSVFNFTHKAGTVVGIYTPSFLASLNVPGLHLHFIADDLSGGGHLMTCEPEKVKIEVQMIAKCEFSLPITLDYLTYDFK